MKSFTEMMEVDVSKYLKERDDAPGKKYLPWAACLELLHKNGANDVLFYPVPGPDGCTLRKSELTFTDKNKKTNRCYEVVVHIRIDEIEWEVTYPVLNGNNPVRDDTMNQLRVSNAIRRAFVKGVAERTGLGFKLWLDEDETPPVEEIEDIFKYSLKQRRRRCEEMVTTLINMGTPLTVIADRMGMDEETFRAQFPKYNELGRFEKSIMDMMP